MFRRKSTMEKEKRKADAFRSFLFEKGYMVN